MGHEFELPLEATVEATPEEVWAAISTGPGIDSWFMGRSEVAGGVVRTAFGEFDMPPSNVTAAEPLRRFAHGSDKGDDGRFVAYEFLIEGRDQGSTLVRMVTSGFLPGDDWHDEFEAMSSGLALYFATLVEYLHHFPSRHATPLTEFGPPVKDWPHAWRTLYTTLGRHPRPGDRVRFGPTETEGIVYFHNSQNLAIRTEHGIYRFLQGFMGPMIASHLLFSDADDQGQLWRSWLDRVFTDPA
ncbi:SRPBCC domain-containing protein [Nonomuraea sp. K274]|uniref:SRPBCC domain-containing protein n=1 Tax=Nonomuraea cypriaca TaxID=1187855 RepID=A0A931AG40_9ACTN|nr:SRPBCC domain-containing protein [Nonomuraea cypriaca]MBF8189614.1 SRPBCC domain-containing protein [Nonomuraea cypriaca]